MNSHPSSYPTQNSLRVSNDHRNPTYASKVSSSASHNTKGGSVPVPMSVSRTNGHGYPIQAHPMATNPAVLNGIDVSRSPPDNKSIYMCHCPVGYGGLILGQTPRMCHASSSE